MKYDVRELEDSVFDDFYDNELRPYMTKTNSAYAVYDECNFTRFKVKGEPGVIGKFQYQTKSKTVKTGSVMLKEFECRLSLSDNDYQYNKALSEKWRDVMQKHYPNYNTDLHKYLNSDNEV